MAELKGEPMSTTKNTQDRNWQPPEGWEDTFNNFVDFTIGKLNRTTAIAVWFILFVDSAENGGVTDTPIWSLAERSGRTEATVRKALRQLEKLGLVEVVQNADGPRYRIFAFIKETNPR